MSGILVDNISTNTILVALIDEENCIGCGKCIRVCPTDAIVGAKHLLHTVIPQFCTSCKACIDVCPTSCISLQTPSVLISKYAENQLKAKKQLRLLQLSQKKLTHVEPGLLIDTADASRRQFVIDAIARVKARKKEAGIAK